MDSLTTSSCPPRYATQRIYNDSDGPFIRNFIEAFCYTTKSSFAGNAGELIELRDWQAELIDDLYELRADGSRRYRRGLIGLPKKQGKSLLASSLALAALITEGQGSEVYSVAASRDQARIVFDVAKQMVQAEPELAGLLNVYRNVIECPSTNSVYRVLSADADLQDGLNPSFVVFDEVHRQPNRELWAIMESGIVTRPNALLLGITTAGDRKEGLCWDLYDFGKKICNKEVESDSFYFRWWEPKNEEADFRDESVWHETMPGLGDFVSLDDVRALAAEAKVNGAKEAEFKRFNLNQWFQSSSSWLRSGIWDSRKDEQKTIGSDEPVVLGFDGSFSGDSTALVVCTVGETGNYLDVVKAWEKPANSNDGNWRVPIIEVEQAIRDACKRYRVLEVACDPSLWSRSLELLADEGLPMVEFPNQAQRMTKATKIFEDAVYQGTLTHSGNPALARHIANAVTKTGTYGYYITKDNRNSPRKIDLAIASLMAFDRATKATEPVVKAPITVTWLD